MIIIGARGFAIELYEVLREYDGLNEIYFFDDVNDQNDLEPQFSVLKNINEVKKNFDKPFNFALGIGNPLHRKELFEKFCSIGGKIFTTISNHSIVGSFNVEINDGCNIMQGVILTNKIRIGKCVLININSTVGHDVTIGNFSNIGPGTNISGGCVIGENVEIGTNVTILPKLVIGDNCIIGAGSVITKSIPENSLVYGNPGRIIKSINFYD